MSNLHSYCVIDLTNYCNCVQHSKLEQSGHAKVIPYRLAHQLGKKSKSRDECLKKYYGCRITPSIVVKMANNLIAV